jgi:hypothetical protein
VPINYLRVAQMAVGSLRSAYRIRHPGELEYHAFERDGCVDTVSVPGHQASRESVMVLSYFRPSLIGYEKARKLYFPIWVDSCAHGCNKEIRSVDGGVLAFVFNEWEDDAAKVLYVDLKAGTVRMSSK